MISTIAFAPPRSACPCRLSASSSRISLRVAPERLAVVEPAPATRSRADLVRWSEAFNSTTSQFISFARAWALDVLPIPGFPYRTSGFFCRDQSRAHSYICLTAPEFPTTSWRRCGLYFSTQSIAIYSSRRIKNTTPVRQTSGVPVQGEQRLPRRMSSGLLFPGGTDRMRIAGSGSLNRVHNIGESNTLSLMRQNTIKKRGVLVFLW